MDNLSTVRRLTLVSCILLSACGKNGSHNDDQAMVDFHHRVCALPAATPDDSPWHIRHLYNCETRSLFIPYQLWSGAHWNGDKDAPCMHAVKSINYLGRPIEGPLEWVNPWTGETEITWLRIKNEGEPRERIQRMVCNKKAIARRHDSTKPNYVYWANRCEIPAGYGWELGRQRHCMKTTIKITHLRLDDNHHFDSITYDWWIKDKFIYQYSYKARVGRIPTPEEDRNPDLK